MDGPNMNNIPFKGETSLEAWLDRHHINRIRTMATDLDGTSLGKYCARAKFLKGLPIGHNIADVALGSDSEHTPHLSFWHSFRRQVIGDIALTPDLDTLIPDGIDAELGQVICDFTHLDGTAISLCPRTKLKQQVKALEDLGLDMRCTFELEFFVYDNTFDDVARKRYRQLNPVNASPLQTIYLLRDSVRAATFMQAVIKRLEWYGIPWEAWNNENGNGQIELNLTPANPVTMADRVIRAKTIIFETAVELGLATTFMAHPQPGFSNGMHIHHSLTRAGESVFFDPSEPHNRSRLLSHWLAGLVDTMPAAVSYLCPSLNAYRRLREFAAPPVTATWGEENKSTGIRLICDAPQTARIEHRVGAGDLNPYLALAVIIAGGLTGLAGELMPPPEFTSLAWGIPADVPRLPADIISAATALAGHSGLKAQLGEEDVTYWVKSRRHEWMNFHRANPGAASSSPTLWEYEHYFAVV